MFLALHNIFLFGIFFEKRRNGAIISESKTAQMEQAPKLPNTVYLNWKIRYNLQIKYKS